MRQYAYAVALSVLGGSAALAADLPPPVAPPPRAPAVYVPVAQVYNWTGIYIGGNLGAGFNGGSYSDTFGSAIGTSSNTTFLGGGQIGANYQFWGGAVIGAEAMFDWLPNTSNTITATAPLASPAAGATATATINNRWLTTATGKLGYAWDRVLIYGKGGAAWLGASNSGVTSGGAVLPLSGPSNIFGWTAGVGLEYAFWGNWSARVEYDYIGLANQTYTVSGGLPGSFTGDVISSSSRNIQLATAGINYKFGW
jgi:outer membrane immunogenic protein